MEKENGIYEIYEGDDLGAVYAPDHCRFRLWAPTAESVKLCLYREGNGGEPFRRKAMARDAAGTWLADIAGDLADTYYTYEVTVDGRKRESADPYARAAGVNGERSMVVDLEAANPEGFAEDGIFWYLENGLVCGISNTAPGAEEKRRDRMKMDLPHAVVTEISVRDMTADERSGIREEYRGRFAGLAQEGTRADSGEPSGIDYLKSLGVTHVQIMPFYDFGSIDESKPVGNQYNWGYDPVNYNVPEGSYSTDPFHGAVRIRECKEMIAALHRAGIGVIMDVVYNHVYDIEGSVFQRCVPDYYFRRDRERYSNASGCGNEVASERPMVRRYIVDSVKYWAREYHIDGFRFDLMGVLDTETMQQIHDELKDIRPDILIYGEGWTAQESTLPRKRRALKENTVKMRGIGMFSDDIRDSIKGHVFYKESVGFVNGRPQMARDLRFSVVGAVEHAQVDYETYEYSKGAWASSPADTVNYVSCHDNLTLWDKLMLTGPAAQEQVNLERNRLAAAIIFTSQGMPFFLCGEETARTKEDGAGGYVENSYNFPVAVNCLKYDRIAGYRQLCEFYRGLIAFRRAHPGFWYTSSRQVREGLHFMDTPEGTLAFTLEGDGERAYIAYNGREEAVNLSLPDGEWGICIDGARAGKEVLYLRDKTASVAGRSAIVGLGR